LTNSDGRLLRGGGSRLDQLRLRFSHTSPGLVVRYLPLTPAPPRRTIAAASEVRAMGPFFLGPC